MTRKLQAQRIADIAAADLACKWLFRARDDRRFADVYDEAIRATRLYSRAGLGGMADLAAGVAVAARRVIEKKRGSTR